MDKSLRGPAWVFLMSSWCSRAVPLDLKHWLESQST